MAKPKNRKTVHSDGSTIQGNNDGNKTPSTVWINIRGTKKQGDLDGKLATILDCLVDEGVLTDDRVKLLDCIFATFEPSQVAGVDIVIIELE